MLIGLVKCSLVSVKTIEVITIFIIVIIILVILLVLYLPRSGIFLFFFPEISVMVHLGIL